MKAIITKVTESTNGILSIEVSFTKDDVELKRENYAIADSPSAIEELKKNILPEEIQKILKNIDNGIYDIKEGDIIEGVL